MKASRPILPLALWLLPSGRAQAPRARQAEPDVLLHVSVNLVQVDAVVTDNQGRHVTNLKAQDFEILQDGRPQKITHFSYISLEPGAAAPSRPPADRGAPPAPPVLLRPNHVRRTIALVVDDLGLSFESMAQVRQALKKFVDEQVQPGDLVAIIRTGAGMGALQQFTSDKRQLYAAVERVRWNPIGRVGVGAFAPFSDDPLADTAAEAPAPAVDPDSFREEYFSVGTLGALNFVIRGLKDLPGRKSVVLVSDNLRIFNREGYSDRVLDSLRRLTDLANRASVVIYTIDARGLPTLGYTAADRVGATRPDLMAGRMLQRHADYFDSQEGLHYLAQETGGFFVHGSNDLGGGIRRVLEDQRGYYLIGYNPDPSTFDATTGRRLFHKIAVKVKVPGMQVRSRTGFYGTPEEDARPVYRTRDQQLLAALTSPFASGGLHLKLTSLFANSARAGSFMQSLLYIDGRDLSFRDEPEDWHKAILDVLVITFGKNGAEFDRTNRTYTIRARGEDYRRAARDGLVYSVNHPVKKPGAYQLRTAVRDAQSEKIGSASQFIEVPDVNKGRLALSGIVARAHDPKLAQPGASPAQAAEGQENDPDPLASPAVRLFHPGQVISYAFQILNVQVDRAGARPQLTTQVRLFSNGRQVYAGQETPFDPGAQTDWKRLLAGGRLQLGKALKPGDYVLQVIVTDKLAKEKYRSAAQWIDFELAP